MKSIASEADLNVSNGIFVLKFWATWCGPCRVLNPVVEKLEKEFDKVTFYSVDVDQAPDLAQKFKVKSLPTLVFLEGDKEAKRVLGVQLIKPLRTILRDLSPKTEEETEEKEKTG
jgi:thioredoxin 1